MTENTSAGAETTAGGSLEVTVPLTPAYPNEYVNVNPTTVTIPIPLVEGEQVTTTPEEVVGTLTNFANPNLIGTLSVWSSYEPATNTLTLCSNDLEDADSTYLSTYMQGGQEQTCKQHTYLSDTAPCGDNPNWNYCTDITPGLMEDLQSTVREAQTAIIDTAVAQGFTVIIRTPPPQVSADEAAKLLLVYENGVFKEPFDPEKDYGPQTRLRDIQSSFYGEIYLQANENFANVEDSTNDPKIASLPWRELWERQFGVVAMDCTSLHFPGGAYPCTPPPALLMGGHVILGTAAQKVPKGAKYVFIMPICAKHNNDDSVYMAAIKYQKGVALHNYLE